MGHEEMDTPIIRVLICHKKRRISEKNSELSVILLNSKRDLFSSPNSHDQKYFPDKRSAELPTIDRAKLQSKESIRQQADEFNHKEARHTSDLPSFDRSRPEKQALEADIHEKHAKSLHVLGANHRPEGIELSMISTRKSKLLNPFYYAITHEQLETPPESTQHHGPKFSVGCTNQRTFAKNLSDSFFAM